MKLLVLVCLLAIVSVGSATQAGLNLAIKDQVKK